VENHPISVDIGDWVIATALEQIRQWQLLHLEIAVSVNVSPRQMQADDFVTKISEKLSLFPMIPPNLLELEILESSAIRDISEVSEVMRDCLKIGVGCALDDFGTGYSSLEYLKMLPAEFLKIDKSFIRDMAEDPDDKTIVSAVIGLASSFRRTAIAEGVETVQQRRELLAMGCKVGQGFGIAHPMPAEEVPDWLRTWRSESHWPD
jgi:EAL domain-containing protein (putative c-di-GMP-specific phosphodiesterase class I)